MPLLTANSLGQFCREVAIQLSPLPTLLDEWGLTPEEFEALRISAGYRHEMTVVANEMAEMGADAGYVYRMKALSEVFIADILKIMNEPTTPTGTRVELIKFCAEMARLKEKPVPNNAPQGVRGPSVVFHFGAGLPVQSMTLVPELGTLESDNEQPKQIQSAIETVEPVVRSGARGFQFDVPAGGE